MSYKVIYDKDNCISANHCMGVQPRLWSKDPDGKAVLSNGTLNKSTGKYELVIQDKELDAYKESALICPVFVIDIVDEKTGKSVLNINPTVKQADKDNVPVIQAHYNSREEWKMDPKGYFTIKPFPDEGVIRARYYGPDYACKFMIEGKNAEEMYNTIMREGLVSTFQHAAYVGCELMKAEIALNKKLPYVQDDPLP